MLELTLETRVDLARSDARHGLGLFETIRIQDGTPHWLELHLERLATGCAFLGLEAPPDAEAVREFLSSHRLCTHLERGILRLIAADGALRAFAGPMDGTSPQSASLGLSAETVRFSGNPLNRFKTLSYLENLRLSREASRRGLFEVVALNERGHLSDGGRTSLFLLRKGRLLTPPVTEGALPGIARRLLLEAGLASELPLDREDLERAEGILLANALRGAIPVAWVEDRPIGLDSSLPVIRLAFEKLM